MGCPGNGVSPPPRKAPSGFGISDRNGRDLWEAHAIISAFKKEQDISWHISEEDLRAAGEDNIETNKHHNDLT